MSHAILVVDDEERLADVLAAALEDLGYRATAVTSAQAALAALEQTRFDLVLTDLRLPAMDGRGLLREVRGRWPELPVVIVTAFAAVRDAVELVKEGAFDYIAKPFEIEDVAATIRRALRLADVVRDNERLRSELAAAVRQCIEDGAEAVVIGGGPLGEAAEYLRTQFDIPIIAPIGSAVDLMIAAIENGNGHRN